MNAFTQSAARPADEIATKPATAPITIYAGKSKFPVLRGILRDIRPIWLMEELGEAYEIAWVPFAEHAHQSEAYRAINPFCRVPAVRVGDMTLFESAAVCAFLADHFGRLAPAPATRERALMDQWLFAAMSTLEPQTGTVWSCDFMREPGAATDAARARAIEALNGDLLPGLDSALAGRDWLLDSGFGVADIIMSCVLRFVHHTGLIAPYRNVARYVACNYGRRAFARAFAISNGEEVAAPSA